MTIESSVSEQPAPLLILTPENLTQLLDNYINKRSLSFDEFVQSISPNELLELLSITHISLAADAFFLPISPLYKPGKNRSDHPQLCLFALQALCDKLLSAGRAGRRLLARLLMSYDNQCHAKAPTNGHHDFIPYLIKLAASLQAEIDIAAAEERTAKDTKRSLSPVPISERLTPEPGQSISSISSAQAYASQGLMTSSTAPIPPDSTLILSSPHTSTPK